MKLPKEKILIVGGYGAVGRFVSQKLAIAFPGKVIIGGRNIAKGKALIEDLGLDAYAVSFDISKGDFESLNPIEIHTAIACIEYLKDDNFVLWCIKNKINYTELATSFEAYQRLTAYSEELVKSQVCLIPGVGLMPGLSGVFVKNAISRLTKIQEIQSFTLLGLGDHHGLDAVRWMLEVANRKFTVRTKDGSKKVKSFSDPFKEKLLTENQRRTFYRFDFGDQHIIANSFNIDSVHSRLAFDSSSITRFIAFLKKARMLGILSRINPSVVVHILNLFKHGSDRFAIQTHCYAEDGTEIIYLALGNKEAQATGVIAAYAVTQLYINHHKGFKRLEELIDFDDFENYLTNNRINLIIKKYENHNTSPTR